MSTGYGWEGIRQVCATLLGARHVRERLRYNKCLTFTLPLFHTKCCHLVSAYAASALLALAILFTESCNPVPDP